MRKRKKYRRRFLSGLQRSVIPNVRWSGSLSFIHLTRLFVLGPARLLHGFAGFPNGPLLPLHVRLAEEHFAVSPGPRNVFDLKLAQTVVEDIHSDEGNERQLFLTREACFAFVVFHVDGEFDSEHGQSFFAGELGQHDHWIIRRLPRIWNTPRIDSVRAETVTDNCRIDDKERGE